MMECDDLWTVETNQAQGCDCFILRRCQHGRILSIWNCGVGRNGSGRHQSSMVPPTRQLLLLDEQKRLFKSLPLLLHRAGSQRRLSRRLYGSSREQICLVFSLCRRRSSKGCFSRHFFFGIPKAGWSRFTCFRRRQATPSGAVSRCCSCVVFEHCLWTFWNSPCRPRCVVSE